MSPIAFHRKIYTSVRLNPPTISVSAATTSDPTTAIGYSGSIDLSGVATVTYPSTQGIGTLGYEWRDGDTVVGVGTTTTLYNLKSPPDGGKVIDQYAIFHPDPTRVGIQTFEPAAINSPFKMGTVVLNVKPLITITQHPDAVGQGSSVSAATFDVSPALPNGDTTIDLSSGEAFTAFGRNQRYDLTPNGEFTVTVELNGAAGGGGDKAGMGGNVKADVTFKSDVQYALVIGEAGRLNTGGHVNESLQAMEAAHKVAGNGIAYGNGYSGGGYTGLFIRPGDHVSVKQPDAIIIAGGGGGAASGKYRPGNDGGGLTGGGDVNQAGTQIGSNNTYSEETAGTGGALNGGNNIDSVNSGGAGGSGWWGGSANRGDSNFSPGPYGGGGGSGYVQPDDKSFYNYLTNSYFVKKVQNSTFGNVTNGGNGTASFKIVAEE